MAVLAVDIGGTNIRTAIFLSPTQMLATNRIRSRDLGSPVPMARFGDYLEQQLRNSPVPLAEITGIGIAVAAVVDHRTGYVKVGENVGWQDVALKALLEQRFALPVHVDVDAFCGALAEARLGAGVEQEHFLYVVLGTGIGHALVLNRQVWHGLHSAANVFGHIKVSAGPPCYCGGAGCLCQYASGQAIAQLGSAAAGRTLGGQAVVVAGRDHEPWAQAILASAHERLALALANAYNLLDIECTVLGGGVVSSDFPDLERVRQLMEPLVYPQIRPIRLRRGQLGGEDVLTGAALLALEGAI